MFEVLRVPTPSNFESTSDYLLGLPDRMPLESPHQVWDHGYCTSPSPRTLPRMHVDEKHHLVAKSSGSSKLVRGLSLRLLLYNNNMNFLSMSIPSTLSWLWNSVSPLREEGSEGKIKGGSIGGKERGSVRKKGREWRRKWKRRKEERKYEQKNKHQKQKLECRKQALHFPPPVAPSFSFLFPLVLCFFCLSL